MAGLFRRIFKIGQAETHSIIDKMEDPVRMTEQGIRDLKKDLQAAMHSLAEVKAQSIRMKKDADNNRRLAEDYERKARLLLQKMQSGDIDAGEGERLARESLVKKEEAALQATNMMRSYENQQRMTSDLEGKVNQLKQTISSYENDLVTLKARAKTAESSRKINEQIAKMDSSGTMSMLERMREKVETEESLASAYGELAAPEACIDDEINKALAGAETKQLKGEDSLADLKAKMGIDS